MANILCRLLRHNHTKVHVILRYAHGGSAMLGPVDRYTAELMLADIAYRPEWRGRQVISGRIVVA